MLRFREVQRAAWEGGTPVRVEEMIQQQPSLPECAVLELIVSEYQLRQEFEAVPVMQEYLSRFPALADQLQRLFALHAMFEDTSQKSSSVDALATTIQGPSAPSGVIKPNSAAVLEKMFAAVDGTNRISQEMRRHALASRWRIRH